MSRKTIRIRPETYAKLEAIASQSGRPIDKTAEQAIDSFYRQVLLERTNQAFAALRAGATAWKAELQERAIWDAALGDNL